MEAGSKVAIVGAAPDSRLHAPFDDPAWEIRACSPGNQNLPRLDLFYEPHHPDAIAKNYQGDNLAALQALGPKVLTFFDTPLLPEAARMDPAPLRAKHRADFLSCTPAWMLADAIEQKPAAIGLWGINMEGLREREEETLGVLHFLELAKFAGIEIHLPPGCPLLHQPEPYPFRRLTPQRRWLNRKLAESEGRRRGLETKRLWIEREQGREEGFEEALRTVKESWT